MLIRALFWTSAFVVIYTYALHPGLLYLLARFRPRPWLRGDVDLSVAVFVSAFNEEGGIAAKVRNLLDQDYPGVFKIIIASDGSVDRTAAIVRSFSDPRIILHEFVTNRGKAAMQNEIVTTLSQDIVIFSDATSVWPKDGITNIVRNFHDPDVGCVAVDLCFLSEREGIVERGQGAYWKYERFLRRYGALVKTNIVASGTTYAIRTPLFHPIRPDIGEDLSTPVQIAMGGKRVVFDPHVIVEEKSSTTHASERRMRTRIAVRNVTGLVSYLKFLRPRYGFAAYQLLIHKYLRVLCWIPLIVAIETNYLLRHESPYREILLIQLGLLLFAAIGYVGVRKGTKSRFTYLPYYFVLLNYTCMVGLFLYLKGVRRATWSPDR
jgi:cellulose synthase/poly-beta-1,6-N-acetylglucosamine synthase-like glycosyltransferase